MDAKKVSPDLSVTQQVQLNEIESAAAEGFRSIIINRPNGESADQPDHADVEAQAKKCGIDVRYIPVIPGKITDADITGFAQALQEMPGPVLAYCKTGTRSIMLWALSQAGNLPTDVILKTAQEAGYDLSGLAPRINDLAQTK